VIGYGLSAKVFHIPFITALPEHFQLTHILQRSSTSALETHPHVTIVRTPEELLATEVDLVIITTPPESHFALAKAALEKGKNVIVEKPFTSTLEEAAELVKLSESSTGILTVFHNRRWDGDFLTIKSVMEKNLLGRIVNFHSAMDRYKPTRVITGSRAWKEQNPTAGGLLLDLGSHLVDQSLALFGVPSTVHANILHQRDRTSVNNDFFSITLDYTPQDGPLVHLQAGNLVRQFSPRFRIDGTKGSLTKFGNDVQETQIQQGLGPRDGGYGIDKEEGWCKLDCDVDGLRYVGSVETLRGDYSGFYKSLAEAIKGGMEGRGKVGVKPWEALEVMKVLEAARKSSEEKCVVKYR
jgi:scyllo-inositol 2-dehydrogenase (NADP+)